MDVGGFFDNLKAKIEIKNKISKLRSKILKMEALKMSLGRNETKISTEIDNWDLKLGEYQNLDLAPDINVEDSFEGMAAEQLALEIPPTVTEINNIAGQMSEVLSGIAHQVEKIDDYIEKILREIALLQAEYDAL